MGRQSELRQLDEGRRAQVRAAQTQTQTTASLFADTRRDHSFTAPSADDADLKLTSFRTVNVCWLSDAAEVEWRRQRAGGRRERRERSDPSLSRRLSSSRPPLAPAELHSALTVALA